MFSHSKKRVELTVGGVMDARYMLSEGVELFTTHHKPWKAEYHMSPCFSSKDNAWGVWRWWGQQISFNRHKDS